MSGHALSILTRISDQCLTLPRAECGEQVPQSVVRPESALLREVSNTLQKHYNNPDIEGARLIFSAVAAHALGKYLPAWVLAIAPPGSAKTDILESLRGLPRVHFVDEVTPKTFLSGKIDERGKKRTKPASLLHRIGSDGILIASDFSTYTADPKALKVVLAQLRRIYDGNYSREFGTEENLEERDWSGRLTILAGAVPEVDRHYQLFQSLGERFIRTRWGRAGGVESGLRAIEHTSGVQTELREAVHDLLRPILTPGTQLPTPYIEPDIARRIVALGELVALGRSHIDRDRWNREIVGVPVTEGNTRLPQQLCQIARGSALLDNRSMVDGDDYQLVCRAAFDSMPPARQAVLLALIRGENPYTLGLPPSTAHRALEDLQVVGVVHGVSVEHRPVNLTDTAASLIEQATGSTDVLSRNWKKIRERQ
jgi:hypothetical protein